MERKLISNITNDQERAFYGSKNVDFDNVTISGPADGESAFKECYDIKILNSNLNLRYPCWHDIKLTIKNTNLIETTRAALWYSSKININKSSLCGIKCLRECSFISINNSKILSDEFGWNCDTISINNCELQGFYAFFGSKRIAINNVKFTGKYSFQYCKNVTILNSVIDTKDAFWHSSNVRVYNSQIKGEYLAWYADGITFVNCEISGTQPICYSKNIKFVNCHFKKSDLSFEYSEIKGSISCEDVSIKNPLKGKLSVKGSYKMIVDENDRSKNKFRLKEDR